MDRPLPRRRHADPHIRLVNLSCGAEHAACSASARHWRDVDDASSSVREGSRGRSGFAARCPLLCAVANRLPYGAVRASPPRRPHRCRLRRSVGPALPRLGSGKTSHSWISRLPYAWRSDANCSPERGLFNAKGRTGPMPSGATVAWAFPNDTAVEMPSRPVPEQSHAE